MSKNSNFEPKPEISKQLDELILNINVASMREVHDLSVDDLDFLLNSIKVKTGSKEVLMDYVNQISKVLSLNTPCDIYNLKVKVLLDNLAKKMCRCVGELKGKQGYSKEALCRKTVFQNRGIDFYTFECDNPNVGPRLNPKKNTKMIIHKYNPDSMSS